MWSDRSTCIDDDDDIRVRIEYDTFVWWSLLLWYAKMMMEKNNKWQVNSGRLVVVVVGSSLLLSLFLCRARYFVVYARHTHKIRLRTHKTHTDTLRCRLFSLSFNGIVNFIHLPSNTNTFKSNLLNFFTLNGVWFLLLLLLYANTSNLPLCIFVCSDLCTFMYETIHSNHCTLREET